MITAEIMGRLGNSMFQVAAVIGHAEKMGTTYNLDFEYAQYYEGPFRNAQKNGSLEQYKEPCFEYQPIPNKSNLSLFGYFQSAKYFNHVKDKIKRKFTPVKQIKQYCDRKYSHLCKDATGIHVRRGDYLNLSDYHHNLSPSYYQSAVNEIGGKFLVFTDDVQYCFNTFPGITIIHEGTIEDLYIMSLCKNFIIANSSYSWWAAYLGEKGGITVAPRQWFSTKKQDLNTSDLYQPNWIQL